ncbi:MAG TPA: redox-sensing transcriptional repressor Rex [Thermoanaerobaculia bacterium]|nr:redox-sensing transcriptional repressor Rex [Thermoanaerobaculia bacterium]
MADRDDRRPVTETDEEVSPLTLNRLSFYLRCLRHLQEEGVKRISSQEMAWKYHLSATQIRKDLAQFGEFGIRGVGYDVDALAAHLNELLGLDRQHAMLIVGMGNLGSALAQYLGFNYGAFRVVAGVDHDPDKIGRDMGTFVVRSTDEIPEVIRESGAEIGVLAVPAEAAQENYDRLAGAGIKAVLNFAPIRLKRRPGVQLKNVDLRINLEELAFFLR